jgi:hypothetical protein
MKYTAIGFIAYTIVVVSLIQIKESQSLVVVASAKSEQPQKHRGGGRREAQVSGKDFCPKSCGGPDAPQGSGTRYK